MTIVFAVNRLDAQEYCKAHNLVFEEVAWVLNVNLLGTLEPGTLKAADVHYTEIFKEMPAYTEALAIFGGQPDV